MTECIRLLTMLAGCPDGATQDTLRGVHRFAPGLLYRCLQRKLVRVESQLVSSRNSTGTITVHRFYITEAGRAAIKSGAGC